MSESRYDRSVWNNAAKHSIRRRNTISGAGNGRNSVIHTAVVIDLNELIVDPVGTLLAEFGNEQSSRWWRHELDSDLSAGEGGVVYVHIRLPRIYTGNICGTNTRKG